MKRIKLRDRLLPDYTTGEEVMNMVTHIVGGALGVVVLVLCMIRAVCSGSVLVVAGCSIYGVSIVTLYTISSVYHGLRPEMAKKVLQVLDHCTIYFLIAGTYTPILLSAFVPTYPTIGWGLLAAEWILAVVAASLTAIDLKKYTVFSMICYIGTGWGIIFFIPQTINMPDIDGLTICKTIREHITCPILFLTARIETADKIKGFSAGADDYIVKPFDLDELGARVAAHLRRENRRKEQSTLRFFYDMVIDYSKREVSICGEKVSLSKKEFDIVELLSANAGQVFDRERIYELVWGLEGDGHSDTIMEHIRKIRSKFTVSSTHNYIETVWGVGYRWVG